MPTSVDAIELTRAGQPIASEMLISLSLGEGTCLRFSGGVGLLFSEGANSAVVVG
jgi:hypothetical protein